MSKNADIKGRAKFISQKMKSIQFAAFCHFLADMFEIISSLSLKMQRNETVTSVYSLKTSVDSLKTHALQRRHLQWFLDMLERSPVEDKVDLQGITLEGSLVIPQSVGVHTLVQVVFSPPKKRPLSCVCGLRERFSTNLISEHRLTICLRYCWSCERHAWPSTSQDLVIFGNDKIQRLTRWFKPELNKAGCNVDAIPGEWLLMKMQINTIFKDKDYGHLWQTLLTKIPYREDFQNVLHLVEDLLILPIKAAQCERAISAQNRIKSSLR